MKTSQRIREQLRAADDGMTVRQICDALVMDERHVRYHLNKSMPDVYIDRWQRNRGTWVPVWAAAEIPAHCPRP